MIAFTTAHAQDLGEISYFNVTGQSDTWIDLEWGIGPSDMTVGKYTLTVDDFLSNDVPCPAPVCTYRVQYLTACSEHKFDLTPHYLVDGVDTPTTTVTINGNTEFALPEAVENLYATNGNGSSGMNISWTEPFNKNCVDSYKVCYRLEGTEDTSCETTTETNILISDLQLCSAYHFTVVGVTPDGDEGASVEVKEHTAYGMPGKVRNCEVTLATDDMVTINWDTPHKNPLCIERYSIEFGETHDRKMINYSPDMESLDGPDFEHHATISDLLGCTNYTFEVFAVSKTDEFGEKVTQYAETAESYPLDITDIILTTNDAGDIIVEWTSNENDRCSFDFTLCYHDEINPGETCFTVPGGGGGGGGGGGDGGHHNFTISQLDPCTLYDVGIGGLSPGGLHGNLTYNSSLSGDHAPGEVRNLKVDSVDITEVQISYDEPQNFPQCVREYDIAVTDLDGFGLKEHRRVDPFIENVFTDLLACTNYQISVQAVSPGGLVSKPVAVETKTEEDTPSEPRTFEAESALCNSLSLVWYQPLDHKRCAVQYQLTWTDTNGDNSKIITSSDFQIKYTVDGLEGDTSFDFTLVALTPSGAVSPSASLTAATDCSL